MEQANTTGTNELNLVIAFIMIFIGMEIILIQVARRKKGGVESPGSSWMTLNIILFGGLVTRFFLVILIEVFSFPLLATLDGVMVPFLLVNGIAAGLMLYQLSGDPGSKSRFNGARRVLLTLVALVFLSSLVSLLLEANSKRLPGLFNSLFLVIQYMVLLVNMHSTGFLIERRNGRTLKAMFIAMIFLFSTDLLDSMQYPGFISLGDYQLFPRLLSVLSTGATFVLSILLPRMVDLFWKNGVIALYIVETTGNEIIYKQIMRGEGEPDGEPGSLLLGDSERLLLGSIAGIGQLLSENHGVSGSRLEYIDKGKVKLVFSIDDDLLFLLVCRYYTPVLKVKLNEFKDKFLKYFGKIHGLPIKNKATTTMARGIIGKVFDFDS